MLLAAISCVSSVATGQHFQRQTQPSTVAQAAIDAANEKTKFSNPLASAQEDGRFEAHNPLEFLRLDQLRIAPEHGVKLHVNTRVLEHTGCPPPFLPTTHPVPQSH